MFEVTARVTVRGGQLDGFKRQAAEMMRQTKEKDTKRSATTGSSATTEPSARFEGYVDADGLLEHAQHVFEARDKLFREYADGHVMTIYGEPSPALAALMEKLNGTVTFKRYEFLQSLESAGSR